MVSTGPELYVYTQTDQADSRRGYRIRYTQGCDVVISANNGTITSPAFGIRPYPHNVQCNYIIRPDTGTKVSMVITSMDLHDTDKVEVFDGSTDGLPLHPPGGFTGGETPQLVLTANSGEMVVRFTSDSLNNAQGFSAVYSADCPPLQPGEGAIGTSTETVFGSEAMFTCPRGQVFATGVQEIQTRCKPGGKWTKSYIPRCQEVYCGPVPQIDNGFAVTSTNVSFNGMASYQCYAGFGFSSGQPIETIVCTEDGTWSYLPVCQGTYVTKTVRLVKLLQLF